MEELKAQILDLPQISVKIENVEVNNAVKGDYIPNPETAEIGQTVVVKSVDENGKPTEWEAADFPEGGGDVYWEDIKDKPFDNDIYEWQEAIRGTATQEQIKDELVFATTLQSNFIPNIGTTYKVVVFDANKTIEFIGVARDNGVDNLTQKEYYIGLEADGNYTKQSFMNLAYMTIFTATSIGTAYNVNVVIYEQIKVIDTLPAEYLPEIPVEKLPQIPAEKLPEDIGGEVSWNDIKDKPFGGSAFEWVENAVGTYSSASMTPMTSFTATFPSGKGCNIVAGKTYQVEILNMGSVTKRFTGIGREIPSGFFPSYAIGLDTDPNRATIPMNGGSITVYLDTSVAGMLLTVKIYEGVETIKPIPVEYLPETVVMEDELEAKGYQTAKQVNALINEALGVIENGTY